MFIIIVTSSSSSSSSSSNSIIGKAVALFDAVSFLRNSKAVNAQAKNLEFQRFGSVRFLISKSGIPRSLGNFP